MLLFKFYNKVTYCLYDFNLLKTGVLCVLLFSTINFAVVFFFICTMANCHDSAYALSVCLFLWTSSHFFIHGPAIIGSKSSCPSYKINISHNFTVCQ